MRKLQQAKDRLESEKNNLMYAIEVKSHQKIISKILGLPDDVDDDRHHAGAEAAELQTGSK